MDDLVKQWKEAARHDDLFDHMVPSDVRLLVKEIERLRALLDEATTNPEGDYYTGLRCGVEDRDIYDRYDAAEYGWDQAFEYVGSVVSGESHFEASDGGPKNG